MQEERWEEDAKLMAQPSSAAQVQDLVLRGSDGMPSLATSLSSVADLIKGHVDAATANGVRWGGGVGTDRCLVTLP
jgi:hypothetical protein